MWERTLSQKSVRLFCEQKVIDEAKADAYVYGYELLISSVVSVLLVVLIAVVCGDVRYALSFLIGFIPQRIYIGGYHATSHTRCYLAFSGLALICILLSKAIAANHLFRILTTVALLGISIFLSPIEAKNKPLSEKKRSSYKMVASVLSSIDFLLAIFNVLPYQSYDVFLKLATSKSMPQTRGATVGSDVTGSQYKHIFVSNLSYTIDNTAIAQIEIGGVETAASLLITGLHLPGSTAVTVGSFLVSVVLATSPSKVVINQSLYEVHFAYDNSYYTHCYHDILYSYDSGGHLMDTTKSYHQAVGG